MIAQPLKAMATATTSNETMSLTEATEVDDISAAIAGACLGAVTSWNTYGGSRRMR